MSVAIRTRRLNSPSPSIPVKPAVPPAPVVHRVEGPESGERDREAPESRHSQPAEASDAGVGRGHYLEHEFTHGRSQS